MEKSSPSIYRDVHDLGNSGEYIPEYNITKGQLILKHVFGEVMARQSCFEINWPLVDEGEIERA